MDLKAVILALILIPLAYASNVVLDEPTHYACPADQQVISGYIENTKSLPDTFRLNVQSETGLSSFVTPEVYVDAYGMERFNIYLSPVCLSLGTHDYKIVATSSRGENVEAQGSVEVQECNLMDLRVSQDKAQMCNGEAAKFEIEIANLGMEEQTFSLSTDLSEKYYTLDKDKFVLAPQERGRATLTLNVPLENYAQGMLTFKIRSESTYSCGSNSREVSQSVYINRCDGLKIKALDAVSVQAAGTEKLSVFLDNSKTPDVFDLKLECPNFVTTQTKQVSLGASESKSFDISIAPKVENIGTFDCKISAISQKFRKTYSFGTKISVIQDYGSKLIAPDSVKACVGEPELIKLKLMNSGKKNTYAISTKGIAGQLSKKEINAAENSANDLIFEIPETAKKGTYNLEIVAASPYVAVKSATKVIVEDCYVAAIKASPSEMELCAGETGSVKIIAGNGGTEEDSFVLSAAAPGGIETKFLGDEAFRLRSGERRNVDLQIRPSGSLESKTYSIAIKSAGTKSEQSANLNLKVLPTNVCHSLRLVPDGDMKRTGAGIGKSFRIMVINDGRFAENLELYLKDHPAWSYITPSKLEIQPDSKEEALIYFAPPLNQKLGEYPIVLEVRGKYLTKNLNLKVQVVALDTSKEAKIDLSEVKLPAFIERDTEIPVKVKITNNGDADLHKATVFFSESVSILEQAPFTLKSGETKDIALVIKVDKAAEEKLQVKMGVYAEEGAAEREFNVTTKESGFEVSQVSKESTEKGFRIVLKLANKGNETLKLVPKSLERVNFSSNEIELKAGEEKELEAAMEAGNETVYFVDSITGKTYRRRIEVSGEGNITGLFTASLSKVLPLLVAIIGGAIALYLIVSRKDKIMQRIDGKKDLKDEEENQQSEMFEEGDDNGPEDATAPEAVAEGASISEEKGGNGSEELSETAKTLTGKTETPKSKKIIPKRARQKPAKKSKSRRGLGGNLFSWMG